jgi:hypothetical protein
MFCHTEIFIDNRKETEYAGFITHLHLLLHSIGHPPPSNAEVKETVQLYLCFTSGPS